MICNQCGREIDEGSSFCGYCGSKIEYKSQNSTQDFTSTNTIPFIEKNNNKWIKYMVIGVAIFLVIMIGVAIAIPILGKIIRTKNIDQIVVQYNSGAISESEANQKLAEILSSTNSNKVYDAVGNARSKIAELSSSKSAYNKAESSYVSGEYENAISEYSQVVEEDSCYEDAQIKLKEVKGKYLNSVYEQANIYLEDEKYDKALELYEKAKAYVNDTELDKKIEEAGKLKADYEKEKIKSLEAEADSLIQDNKFKKAIDLYNELYDITNDKTYNVKIEGIEDKWVDYVISNAEWYLREGQLDKAKAVMSSAKNNVKDKSKIVDEEERIDSFQPLIIISDSEDSYGCIATGGDVQIYGLKDDDVLNNGTMPVEGGVVCGYGAHFSAKQKNSWIEYVTNGEYDVFSTTLGLTEEYKDTDCNCFINVYCDGVLTFTSDSVQQGSVPINISTDISGAQKVRIELIINYANYGPDNYYSSFEFVVFDSTLSKKYSPLDTIKPATPTDAE